MYVKRIIAYLWGSRACDPKGGLRRMEGQKLLDGPSQGGLRRMEGQKLLDGPSQGGLRRMEGQKLLDGPSQGGLRRMEGQKGANLRLSSGHPQVGYYPAHIHSRKGCEGF